MIEAFEKITLRSNQRNERGNAKREPQKSKEETKSVVAEHEKTELIRRGPGTCFNCKEKGHRAADCNQPRTIPDKKADDRPGKSTETSRSSTEMNLIQPITETEPYTVPVSYSILNQGKARQYSFIAIIDTGSPISLIKPEYAPVSLCAPYEESNREYSGVNKSPVKIFGVFEKIVKIGDVHVNIKFHVVPEDTMSGSALLGRDFISNPAIKIVIDQGLKILTNESELAAEPDNFVSQLMHIDCITKSLDEPQLNINPAVHNNVAVNLKQIYENTYLKKESDLPEYQPEMSICLKHDQPISFRARRLAYTDKIKLRAILDDLIKEGTIRESASPYAVQSC